MCAPTNTKSNANAGTGITCRHCSGSNSSVCPLSSTCTTTGSGTCDMGVNMSMFGTGVAADLVPNVRIVSPSIRRDIISGKDINLAALLIPGYKTDLESTRHLMVIGEAIPLKTLTHSRLSRN